METLALTKNVLQPSAVRSLRAGHCGGIQSLTLQLPHGSALRDLYLGHCGALTEVALATDRLRQLHLSGCASLRRLDLRCSALRCDRRHDCHRKLSTAVSIQPDAGMHRDGWLNILCCA